MTKLLIIDTETGGVDPALHSLLSVGAVVWDDGVFAAELSISVLEDPISVTPRALEINGIDLAAHARGAALPLDAVRQLEALVELHFAPEIASGEKVVLAGHNVGFDVGFLKRLYRLADRPYERLMSHRSLDTASVLKFLSLSGALPSSANASDTAFALLGVEFEAGERHSALGDARATAQLLNVLLKMQPTPGRRHGRAAA